MLTPISWCSITGSIKFRQVKLLALYWFLNPCMEATTACGVQWSALSLSLSLSLCAEGDASQCNVRVCSVWVSLGVEGGRLCEPVHSCSSPALYVPWQWRCPELHCSWYIHRSSIQNEVRSQTDHWRSLLGVPGEVGQLYTVSVIGYGEPLRYVCIYGKHVCSRVYVRLYLYFHCLLQSLI